MARDAMGLLLDEIRAYLQASGQFTTAPVRGGEPGPNDKPPMVILTHASQIRARRTGVTTQRFNARSYGTTPQSASQLAGLVSDALHDVGPRVGSGAECNRTGIWSTSEEVGAQAGRDPDTDWPYELAVYNAQVAAVGV